MYDLKLTRQSLPDEEYLYLLGVSISVFNSNTGFIIENIIRTDPDFSWYSLIDREAGQLKEPIKQTIGKHSNTDIENLFSEIVEMRNRIIHSFRITSKENKQILATKVKNTGQQFYIDEDYLRLFITKNNQLSELLSKYRGF